MALTREQFINKYKNAVSNITTNSGIFPEVLFAQAIVESQGKVNGVYYPGESQLAKKYNNYFGIKADKRWTGPKVNLKTGEVINNTPIVVSDYFRVYSNFEDSAKDYVRFLQLNPRYKAAGVFDAKTFKEQIEKIHNAGYATNPSYKDIITSVATRVSDFIKANPIKTGGTTLLLVLIGAFIIFAK